MKIFFTADTHFGSERHLELSKRPFKDVNEMDRTMIRRWHRVVGKNDIVYHLGDFGDAETVLQLNGKIFMVMGNYETGKKGSECVRKLRPYVGFMPSKAIIKVPLTPPTYKEDDDGEVVMIGKLPETVNVQLVHEPSKAENLADSFILFGHIHKLQMVKRNGLNVGVDCHNYTPVELGDVLFWRNAILNHYDEEVFLPKVGM